MYCALLYFTFTVLYFLNNSLTKASSSENKITTNNFLEDQVTSI